MSSLGKRLNDAQTAERLFLARITLAATLALCVTGCDQNGESWEVAPLRYVCSDEQMKTVEARVKFCRENTSYYPKFCHNAAIMAHCDKKPQTK